MPIRTMARNLLLLSLVLACSKSVSSAVSTECGEVLGGDERLGQIAYKSGPDDTYDFQERCMWTIRISSADKITFDLVDSGIVAGDVIVVRAINETSVGRSFIMNVTGDQVTVDANLVVLTFFSGSLNNGRGFVLNYTGIGESTHVISNRSRDVIVTEAGSLKHPESTEFYDSNEVSTFLLSTVGFKENYTHIGSFNLTIEGLEPGIDGCDNDFIFLQFFSFAGGWISNRVYCDDDIVNQPYVYPFPVLLTFYSNSADSNGRGFKIDWEYIPNGIKDDGKEDYMGNAKTEK